MRTFAMGRLGATPSPPKCGDREHSAASRHNFIWLRPGYARTPHKTRLNRVEKHCPQRYYIYRPSGGGRWSRLEGLIPPPVGAFTGRAGTRRHRWPRLSRWAGQRPRIQRIAVAVGDHEPLGRPGNRNESSMVQPMMVRAQQDQIGQLRGPAVLPMHDVMSMQTAGGPAARHRTTTIPMLEGTA